MSFQVSATGSIQQSAVDRTTVDALLHATDNFTIYLALATFFAGAALSTAPALAATVRHPIPIYIALTAEAALAVAMIFALLREGRHVRELRQTMLTAASGISFVITPTVGAPAISGSPMTGADIQAGSEEETSDEHNNDSQ